MRTLGAVEGQLQALFNGGFELVLRLWSPPCGRGIMGSKVGVRAGVSFLRFIIMIKVRVRVRVRVRARAGAMG